MFCIVVSSSHFSKRTNPRRIPLKRPARKRIDLKVSNFHLDILQKSTKNLTRIRLPLLPKMEERAGERRRSGLMGNPH